jgi:chromosomal replication initiation ATPase DnaA
MENKIYEPEKIINTVCLHYKLPKHEIFKHSRDREIVTARQMIQTLMLDHTRMAISKIGIVTGGKDRATINHSHEVIYNLIETDKRIKNDYETILQNINYSNQLDSSKVLKRLIINRFTKRNYK